MLKDLKSLLTRSKKGRAFLSELQTEIAQEAHARRRAIAAEIRALRERQERETPALRAAVDKAERDREKALNQAKDARARYAEAMNALMSMGNEIDAEIRKREVALREEADPAFEEFVGELVQGWDASRSRGTDFFGIRFGDCTLEGQTLLARTFLLALERARGMATDGDIADPHAAIAEARETLVQELRRISDQYLRERVTRDAKRQSEREIALRLLEADLGFKRRQGWPESALAEYREAQRAEIEGMAIAS